MIQRIQTIYLFVAAVLLVVAMVLPVGHFYTETTVSSLTNLSVTAADGTVGYVSWPLFVILLLGAVLSFVTIFLYKNRMLQVRLTVCANVLLVAYYVVAGILAYSALSSYGSFTPSMAVCLPLIALILNGLAIRGIKKDEKLVRSYNTIR